VQPPGEIDDFVCKERLDGAERLQFLKERVGEGLEAGAVFVGKERSLCQQPVFECVLCDLCLTGCGAGAGRFLAVFPVRRDLLFGCHLVLIGAIEQPLEKRELLSTVTTERNCETKPIPDFA
jgi:hypothetical protein